MVRVSLFFAAVALVASAGAQASVKLFRAGQSPSVISADLKVGTASYLLGQLGLGWENDEVAQYVVENREALGVAGLDASALALKSKLQHAQGSTLRYSQRLNGVLIDGAEVVAVLDREGKLASLNSSLKTVAGVETQPTLSRELALAAAASAASLKDVEEGEGNGLLVADVGGAHALVWQFAIRERADGSNPVQVRVLAQGPKAGTVVRMIPLGEAVSKGTINIYDGSISVVVPNPIYKGVQVLADGKPTLLGRAFAGDEANAANATFEKIRGFYNSAFGRRSWDGKGADIDASVNAERITIVDVLGMKQNAAWMGPWHMFVFGAGGDDLAGFTSAVDVVGHEFTHAVVSTTSDLAPGGQSGALNEHLADVFGATIHQFYDQPANPFLIGASVLRGKMKSKAEALRDMMHPEKSLGGQPAKMSDIPSQYGPGCQPAMDNDSCGVHLLNGVPNRAAALILDKLGFDNARDLFYRVMTVRLRSSSDFADYRDQMLEECASVEDQAPGACDAVKAAFADVGL